MRLVLSASISLALVACNGTDLENTGQQLGAKADNAVEDVNEAADEVGNSIENVAYKADNAVEGAAQSIDRGIARVENAADAAERELERK